ncbi:ribonuclease T [Marinagarivorans cellulosilyticus]|uniref:Ribonuclease T n=1 Tax=Marinagarivorans cellulosilyticus TaxID=2721545 RepID=A0AAN1WI20_9GAMM|nr:ribonuclease T [Marinagarivorans cellulosilyticus]BCD97949.1 ribonuclease T [Marinagarivorans cellulosilyticus]
MSDTEANETTVFASRFRGYLPVIIDVETGGFNAKTDALLEIAAVMLDMDDDGIITPGATIEFNVEPFEGANIEQSALDFTGIKVDCELRGAVPEDQAMNDVFSAIRKKIKQYDCKRAIMVGHNAHFDLGFVHAAAERCAVKRNPFHPFSCFDTATLSGLAFGHTVLAKTCQIAGIDFSNREAHSAAYDAQKTAELFCMIVNKWQELGGWPIIREDFNPFTLE